jgi:hypothetical protein
VHPCFDAAAQDVDWVRHEVGGVDLSDRRLNRRVVKVTEQLAKSPTVPINEACGDWASTQAAYRLFNNPKATPQALIEPHIEATVRRMSASLSPVLVLVLQDTVFFSYGTHPKTRGLGPIGESNSTWDRGLIMHNALALTSAGVPLGLLSQNIWARKEVPEGEGYQEKIERLQCTPIEEKESAKWLIALRETVARTPRGVTVITIADRESDFFEFLTQATDLRANFLIRARTDRRLIFEDSAGAASMIEALAGAPTLGKLTVQIPGNGSRRARTAQLAVRTARVTIMPPQRRGQAKISGSTEPISVNLIGATEQTPPAGTEAVSWVLLTNRPVPDFAAASEKIEWYGKRWNIETWHKVLKSGCKVEDCLLEEASRLQRYLTLFSIIAVRLMHVTYRARAQPEAPATEVFSPEEIEALHVRVHKKLPPADPPTLRDTVRLVGRLGGHLGRKGDGEPGVTVLWRGWLRLYEDVEILRAHKQALGLSSS